MTCRLALALLCALTLAAAVPAQDTPLFLAYADFDAWNASYPQSNLARTMADPAIQSARQALAQQLQQANPSFNLDALLALAQGQAAMAVMQRSGGAGPSGQQIGGIAFRQPGGTDALLAQVQALSGGVPPEEITQQGDIIVFGEDASLRQMLAERLPQGAAGLGMTPTPGAFFTLRVNMAALAALSGGATGQMGGTSPMQMMGFGNAHALALSMSFEGPGITCEGSLDFDGPRGGLPGFLGPDAPFGVLDLAPQTATGVVAIHTAPFEQIYDWAMQWQNPQATQMMTQQFQQTFQVDLRQQLLPAFGQEVALIAAPEAGPMGMGGALVFVVDDPAPITQLATRLGALAGGMMMPQMPMQPGQQPPAPPPPQSVTQGSATYSMIAVMGQQVCYGPVGSHFVVSSSQALMNSIIATADGGPNVRQSAGFQAMQSSLADQGALLAFGDASQTASSPSTAAMIAGMTQGMAMGGADPGMAPLLAAIPALMQHAGQSAGLVTTTPNEIRFRAHSTSGMGLASAPLLAAIAVPNFMEARVRAQVSRVRSDMRSMATAIESYYVDYNAYPRCVPGNAPNSVAAGNPLYASTTTLSAPTVLSTPVAYITSLMEDPFTQPPGTFAYFSDGPGWILVSPGPDQDFDLNPSLVYKSSEPQPSPALLNFAFDPTNGTVSNGDIFRVRQ